MFFLVFQKIKSKKSASKNEIRESKTRAIEREKITLCGFV